MFAFDRETATKMEHLTFQLTTALTLIGLQVMPLSLCNARRAAFYCFMFVEIGIYRKPKGMNYVPDYVRTLEKKQ